MNLKQFKRLVNETKRTIEKRASNTSNTILDILSYTEQAAIENIIQLSPKFLPEHKAFFERALQDWKSDPFKNSRFALEILNYILKLLKLEESAKKELDNMKIFSSSEDKLKQSVISFRNEDYPSTINNLNTALELLLKDKLGIPTTISKINTVKIIEILVKHKIGPYTHFQEAKKHICLLDNKIKHQGYCPTTIECINGIKVMEELISKLRNVNLELDKEVRKKIYKEPLID